MLRSLGDSTAQLAAFAGVFLLGLAIGILVHLRRLIRWPQIVLAVIGVNALLISPILIAAGGYSVWFRNRPAPAPITQTLFDGISYVREVRQTPRPLVIHVVKIDLTAPGIRFLVTPGDAQQALPFTARTTSQFLTEFGVQVAVNGSFFYPYYSNAPWDFFPRVGDRVNSTGITHSEGKRISFGNGTFPALYLSAENEPSLDAPAEIYNAISGNPIVLRDGRFNDDALLDPAARESQPRTALGYSADRKTLLIVCVDGRQPNYSEGISLSELADLIMQYGGASALAMDGGGSVTLVAQESDGKPRVLNSPIDNYLPGRERPIANHLGVFAATTK